MRHSTIVQTMAEIAEPSWVNVYNDPGRLPYGNLWPSRRMSAGAVHPRGPRVLYRIKITPKARP